MGKALYRNQKPEAGRGRLLGNKVNGVTQEEVTESSHLADSEFEF